MTERNPPSAANPAQPIGLGAAAAQHLPRALSPWARRALQRMSVAPRALTLTQAHTQHLMRQAEARAEHSPAFTGNLGSVSPNMLEDFGERLMQRTATSGLATLAAKYERRVPTADDPANESDDNDATATRLPLAGVGPAPEPAEPERSLPPFMADVLRERASGLPPQGLQTPFISSAPPAPNAAPTVQRTLKAAMQNSPQPTPRQVRRFSRIEEIEPTANTRTRTAPPASVPSLAASVDTKAVEPASIKTPSPAIPQVQLPTEMVEPNPAAADSLTTSFKFISQHDGAVPASVQLVQRALAQAAPPETPPRQPNQPLTQNELGAPAPIANPVEPAANLEPATRLSGPSKVAAPPPLPMPRLAAQADGTAPSPKPLAATVQRNAAEPAQPAPQSVVNAPPSAATFNDAAFAQAIDPESEPLETPAPSAATDRIAPSEAMPFISLEAAPDEAAVAKAEPSSSSSSSSFPASPLAVQRQPQPKVASLSKATPTQKPDTPLAPVSALAHAPAQLVQAKQQPTAVESFLDQTQTHPPLVPNIADSMAHSGLTPVAADDAPPAQPNRPNNVIAAPALLELPNPRTETLPVVRPSDRPKPMPTVIRMGQNKPAIAPRSVLRKRAEGTHAARVGAAGTLGSVDGPEPHDVFETTATPVVRALPIAQQPLPLATVQRAWSARAGTALPAGELRDSSGEEADVRTLEHAGADGLRSGQRTPPQPVLQRQTLAQDFVPLGDFALDVGAGDMAAMPSTDPSSPSAPTQPPAPQTEAALPDVAALAKQVYPILKRLLAVERERARGR